MRCIMFLTSCLYRLRARILSTALVAFCLSVLPAHAQDDISVQRGEYTVYYSVFNTSFLSPANARAISVVRAKDRGLVNISIAREGTPGTAAVPDVSGTYFNLVHRHPLRFREVVEPDAVYYLAEFDISNDNETIVFDIQVEVDESTSPIAVKFQRQMFLNE